MTRKRYFPRFNHFLFATPSFDDCPVYDFEHLGIISKKSYISMKQKFRVTWQVLWSDEPCELVCDNWSQLSGCLDSLIKLGVLFVDISIINE